MDNDQDLYSEISYYTLQHGGAAFIHQHVVDAFAAQTATGQDQPIKIVFALVGLYLHVEKLFTGREVQLAHMKLGEKKQSWPVIPLPANRGAITAADVLTAPAGSERDAAIHQWCVSVWEAFHHTQPTIEALLHSHAII